jgi:hypothetical protein
VSKRGKIIKGMDFILVFKFVKQKKTQQKITNTTRHKKIILNEKGE